MVYLTIYLCFLGYFIVPLLQCPAYRYHTKVLDLCQSVPGFGVLFVNRIVFFLKLELMTFIANMQNKIDFHMLTLFPKATYSFNNFFLVDFWGHFMDSHVICKYSFYCPLFSLYTFPCLALLFAPARTASMKFVGKTLHSISVVG